MFSSVSGWWAGCFEKFLPGFENECEEMTSQHKQLMLILDEIRFEGFFDESFTLSARGRPKFSRSALACAFIAKAVFRIETTRAIIERLQADKKLRRICGFKTGKRLPCEASFSNAFAEFAHSGILNKVHEVLVQRHLGGTMIENVARDSTEIDGREKPLKKEDTNENSSEISAIMFQKRASDSNESNKPKSESAESGVTPITESAGPTEDFQRKIDATDSMKPLQKIGEEDIKKTKKVSKKSSPKNEEHKPLTKLELQAKKSQQQILNDLSKNADIGGKKNSKGHTQFWIGYKLHMDVAPDGTPIACLLTSASVHDSMVSLALESITNQRVLSLYTLADAAYDARVIKENIESYGKIAVIDHNPRRGEKLDFDPCKSERYKARTTVERTNSEIKDNLGGRNVFVRGHSKVLCHLMFGVITLCAKRIVLAG